MNTPPIETLYCLARNAVTGLRELKTTDTLTRPRFEQLLTSHGYVVNVVFSENDYKRVRNKKTLRGPLQLNSKDIHIYDTYEDILSGKYGTPPQGAKHYA